MELIRGFLVIVFVLKSTFCQEPLDDFSFTSNFIRAVKCKYFVDKSLLMKDFMDDEIEKNYVTTPNHFGKTFNLQMMKHFFEIQVNETGWEIPDKESTSNFKLFTNTKIYKEQPAFFENHFGKYPVIYIDYGRLGHVSSYSAILQQLKSVLLDTFTHHRYLMYVKTLWTYDLNIFTFRKYVYSATNEELSEYAIQYGFEFLAKVLCRHFGRPTIVLIDQYDSYVSSVIFEENTAVDKTIRLIQLIHRSLFTVSNQLVQKVFCTGTVHISGSGISSTNGDIEDRVFLHKHRYSNYFGIVPSELTEVLKKFTNGGDIVPLSTEIQQLYGGYQVLGTATRIYNTVSIFKHLRDKQLGGTELTQSRWTKPTYHRCFRPLLYRLNIKIKIIELLENRYVELLKSNLFITRADVLTLRCLIANTLTETCGNEYQLIYKFLLHLGYITYTSNQDPRHSMYYLQLSNAEIKSDLETALIDVEIQQFDFDLKSINAINNIFNDISESSCTELHFKTLFTHLTDLILGQGCNVSTVNDLQVALISILRSSFHDKVQSKLGNKKTTQIILNNNNITFAIATTLVQQNRRVPLTTIRSVAMSALRVAIDIATGNPHIVCLGISVGITEFKGKITRTLGLSVAKKIQPEDHLNNTLNFL